MSSSGMEGRRERKRDGRDVVRSKEKRKGSGAVIASIRLVAEE